MNHNVLRLKQNDILRNMCVDTNFLQDQLIQPIFISEKVSEPVPITGLDNNYVMNLDNAKKQIEEDLKLNCKFFIIYDSRKENFKQFQFRFSF